MNSPLTHLLYHLPLHTLSRWAGRLATLRWRWWKNSLIRAFIYCYDIDLSELARQDINQYAHFNDFFTRELAPHARPSNPQPDHIVSPVDGIISEFGSIQAGQLLQAKGIHYDLASLLGESIHSTTFDAGQFITLYLSPRDYHRIHMPISATLEKMMYLPGQLISLHPWAIAHIPQLFSRNERVICWFSTAIGPMIMVLVGATLVGSIATTWHGTVNAAHAHHQQTWHYPSPDTASIKLKQCRQLGHFQFGSTVILLFPGHHIQWHPALRSQQAITMGSILADVLKEDKKEQPRWCGSHQTA